MTSRDIFIISRDFDGLGKVTVSEKKKFSYKKKFRKKFRFLGTFMNIPSFSKFRQNIPEKKSKNSGKFSGIFLTSGPEFRLLGSPLKINKIGIQMIRKNAQVATM